MTPLVLTGAVIGKLAALGNSPDEVAKSLHQAGIRGYRSSVIACPIARHLMAQQDLRLAEAYVGTGTITVINKDFIVAQDCVPPPAVAGFIVEFDRGEFPDLATGANQTWENLIEGTEGGGR